jgi:hypothetical protein
MVVYVNRHNNIWTTIRCCTDNNSKCIQNNIKMCSLKVQFCESTKSTSHVLDEWICTFTLIWMQCFNSNPWPIKRFIWKPSVIYLYSFVIHIFVSLLISFFICENDLDHIRYDDTTNFTMQINNMLDYSSKTI